MPPETLFKTSFCLFPSSVVDFTILGPQNSLLRTHFLDIRTLKMCFSWSKVGKSMVFDPFWPFLDPLFDPFEAMCYKFGPNQIDPSRTLQKGLFWPFKPSQIDLSQICREVRPNLTPLLRTLKKGHFWWLLTQIWSILGSQICHFGSNLRP